MAKLTKNQKATIVELSATYYNVFVGYVENINNGIVGMYGEKEMTFYGAMQAWGELRGYIAGVCNVKPSDIVRVGNTGWMLCDEHGIRMSGCDRNVAFM